MLTRYAQHNLTWVDLVAPTPAEVRALIQEFDIEPLIAEELLLPSFKPKVERRGDAIYVILHFPTPRIATPQGGASQRAEQEIDFVIGKHFLITTRYENIDPLHSFAKAFEVNAVLGRGGASHGGHLFSAMARNLYEALGNECDNVRQHLQEVEDRIFNGRERQMVIELSQTGRTIHDFRQALAPHREMLSSLEPASARFFGSEFAYYIRELVGGYERVQRMLDNLYESLSELRATNDSLLNTKQNEIMKTLTVLAFLFLPLTFIGQVFGMSVPIPLAATPGAFWIIVSGMGILALACFVYFKRKGWL
jgi:magnesium transporter